MSHATETPITDDLIQALAAKHLNDKEYKAVTFTRWRDGIDVDYPTVGLVKFANAIRADAAESALRSAGERVREECAKVLDRRANGQTEAKLENWRDGYTDTGNECSWAAVCLAEAAEEIRALPVPGEVNAAEIPNDAQERFNALAATITTPKLHHDWPCTMKPTPTESPTWTQEQIDAIDKSAEQLLAKVKPCAATEAEPPLAGAKGAGE